MFYIFFPTDSYKLSTNWLINFKHRRFTVEHRMYGKHFTKNETDLVMYISCVQENPIFCTYELL